MSNDPLDSFFVPNKQTPAPDDIPSVRVASARPTGTRREPKLSTTMADTPADAVDKAVKAERPSADRVERTSAEPAITTRTTADAASEPTRKTDTEEPAAEKTRKELKAAMRAAKQTARQAERRDRHRKSRGSRFALYLVFVVAAGLVLMIAGNVMVQSMEQLRDARASSAAANTTAVSNQSTDPATNDQN